MASRSSGRISALEIAVMLPGGIGLAWAVSEIFSCNIWRAVLVFSGGLALSILFAVAKRAIFKPKPTSKDEEPAGDSLDPAQQARLAEYADRLDRYSKNLRSKRGYSIETEENLLGKIAKVALEIKDDITHTMEREKLAKYIFTDVDLEEVDLRTRRNIHKICSDAELVVKRLRGLLK